MVCFSDKTTYFWLIISKAMRFFLNLVLIIIAIPSFAAHKGAICQTELQDHTIAASYRGFDHKKDETGKEKLRNVAKKAIDAIEKLGIPTQHEGMDLLGVFSIGAFLFAILLSLFIPILPAIFYLAALALAILSIFNITQNKELTGKGFAYVAAVLSGLGILISLGGIVLAIIWLLGLV
jgi:hypothetical protein